MVPRFVWTKELTLGVVEMDADHKVIVSLMDALANKVEANRSRSEISAAISDLKNFTKKHFDAEEAYQEKIGFPGRKMHAQIHKDLLAKLSLYADDFEKSGVVTDAFFKFLNLWLKAHITGIDRKYVDHAHSPKTA